MRFPVLFVTALVLSACSSFGAEGSKPDVIASEDGDTAYIVAANDPELIQARHEARCTVDEFIRRLQSPPSTQTDLALKASLREGDEVEHLWLEILRIDGDSLFTGTINNDVLRLQQVTYEDTVTVSRADVSDWYAVDRDTLVGGFSVRVFRQRQSGVERIRQDSASGYVVGDDLENWQRLPKRCL
jgi:uncharacterized protein YegJ (DUF2314 family)